MSKSSHRGEGREIREPGGEKEAVYVGMVWRQMMVYCWVTLLEGFPVRWVCRVQYVVVCGCMWVYAWVTDVWVGVCVCLCVCV